jgi:hypothetical protein
MNEPAGVYQGQVLLILKNLRALDPVRRPVPNKRSGRRIINVRHLMKLNTLLCLFLTLTFCTDISRSAEDRSKFVAVDFKVINGPGGFGSLVVSEQETCITVQVPVDARPQAPPGAVDTRPDPDVPKLGLQVWLLKADGTVVSQQSADSAASIKIGNAGAEQLFVMFQFTKVPVAGITGIVFRRAGQLYTQQITATDWRPR